jgi:peptide/nickel transport system permease protein
MILEQNGLGEPLYVQYVLYIKNLVLLNLGISYTLNQPVSTVLFDKVLNTLALMLPAIILAFIIGPIVGAFLAWKRNTRIDSVGIGVSIFARAAPVFWIGMLGIMVFSFRLGWLPSGGMHSPTYIEDSLVDRFVSIDFLRHLALPLAVTTFWWLMPPVLVMRNNMIETLGADFIQLNRAEGLPWPSILYRHAARNAMLPVAHYGAMAVGFAFGGSVVIETVFSWPGVGRMMWEAVTAHDYPLAQGAFLILAVMILVMNFLIDILSVYIDPRVVEEEV